MFHCKTLKICTRAHDDKASEKVWPKFLEKCKRTCAQKQLFKPTHLPIRKIPQTNNLIFLSENRVKHEQLIVVTQRNQFMKAS